MVASNLGFKNQISNIFPLIQGISDGAVSKTVSFSQYLKNDFLIMPQSNYEQFKTLELKDNVKKKTRYIFNLEL